MKTLYSKKTNVKFLAVIFCCFCNITFSLAQNNEDPYYHVTYDEGNGKPLYYTHQIIVKFKPDILKPEVINDTSYRQGELQTFFSDETLNIIEQLGFWNNMVAEAHTEKIYWFLTTDDTYSITRLGDTIPLDKHWSSLLIFWPIDHELNILQVCDSLKQYFPFILEAQPNYLYTPDAAPNDPLYSNQQFSLFNSGNFPNAYINVENAWNIETGKSYVKVGVYDFSVFWGHEDFGNGTWAGCKVKGGWSFPTQQHVSQVPHPPSTFNGASHGTACAGIIGALRNNEIGVAGIAGGDVQAGNNGVDLYSFGIFGGQSSTQNPDGYVGDNQVASVIVQGSIQNPGNGYGLHIQNHSWSGNSASPELKSALNTAVLNQCIVVCSRGNSGTTTALYPASYNDEFVISVGASGTNGEHKTYSNGDYWWRSSYGGTMDVIAPGTTEIIESTIDANVPFTGLGCGVNNSHYQCFNGTSAAAPHVAGVAALLYSRHNTNAFYGNNLSPEDVEELLQRYATDIGTPNYPAGYDQENGWGRINAAASIDVIKNHQYRVHHFGGNSNFTSVLSATNQQILTTNQAAFGIPNGNYLADRYTITHTFTNTFSSSTQILGVWPRQSATNGLSAATGQNGDRFEILSASISGNSVTVTIITHAWFIKSNIIGQVINLWLTVSPSSMFTGYSVHTYDPSANVIKENIAQNAIKCNVFPNPTSDVLNVTVENDIIIEVEIFDLFGKLIYMHDIYNNKSSKQIISLDNINTGIFVCRVHTNKGVYNTKFIRK